MKSIVKTAFAALTGVTAIAAIGLSGCNKGGETAAPSGAEEKRSALSREEIKARSFQELFDSVSVKGIPEDVFKLIGEDFAVLTAGDTSHYNSMTAGWGGWGIIFGKPSTFLMLRSNRYTLELMRKERRYTMAFFDEEYKGDVMEFGKQSGRDSDAKMKNTKLTAVQTPAGNMTFKEAKLIIECKLVQVTTVSPEDFYTEESKKFVTDAYAEVKGYHKVVFGEITGVWVRR